jgi:DNA polymerase II
VTSVRSLSRSTRGRIAYVITSAGPEPAAQRSSPMDYEHYVDKQVRPVAQPVLALLGLDFDHVIGDDRQPLLFPSPSS